MKNFDFRSLAGSGAVAGGQYLPSEHRVGAAAAVLKFQTSSQVFVNVL